MDAIMCALRRSRPREGRRPAGFNRRVWRTAEASFGVSWGRRASQPSTRNPTPPPVRGRGRSNGLPARPGITSTHSPSRRPIRWGKPKRTLASTCAPSDCPTQRSPPPFTATSASTTRLINRIVEAHQRGALDRAPLSACILRPPGHALTMQARHGRWYAGLFPDGSFPN